LLLVFMIGRKMSGTPTFHDLLQKIDTLKTRLEQTRKREEKLMILMEFRFLLDAVDELVRKT